MPDCLFCKIIEKKIPAEIVYEDAEVIAFLDINPVNPGHALVLPKEHFDTFEQMPAEKCGGMTKVMQSVTKALLENLGYEGVNLILNDHPAAGQVVPHAHFHVVPRKVGDGYVHWHGKAYEPGEMAMIAEKIKASLV